VTEYHPAPKQLAMLAATMRDDWPYDEIRAALIACSEAGWTAERIYRETFRLLLLADSGPKDLRMAARNPLRPVPGPGPGTFSDGLASLREAYEKRTPRLHAPAPGNDIPEGVA
jgi:hypothetical protein